MKKFLLISSLLIAFLLVVFSLTIAAQTIRVHPTGVNVNSQNPTTVFLTYGQIPPGYVPAEGVWCGAIVPAAPPAIGFQCRPDTIYGVLPTRYNRSQPSGNNALTDVMGIPPSVVRRAYQSAEEGAGAGFFYVRRFVSTAGQPDQYVPVTCRMTGGGARVPFALTNVEIKTPSSDEPILYIKAGEKFPEVFAEILYNGTGRLKGRWEIVQPGEEPPRDTDLLTEATLPIEQRGTQKRYAQISRFNHFLAPVGKFRLPLEINERMPILAKGQYILLLRIEATDDKESDSNLAAVGAGSGTVHSGAVASFPMPQLKFFVTGESQTISWETSALVSPISDSIVDNQQPLTFVWKPLPEAAVYRLEVMDQQNKALLSAMILPPLTNYRAPSWFREKTEAKNLTWRVSALDAEGKAISQTERMLFQFR